MSGVTIGANGSGNAVEIPAITSIETTESSEWEEIDLVDKEKNLLFKGLGNNVQDITINFTLSKQAHSSSKDVEIQRKDVKTLEENTAKQNDFSYGDSSGKILIESIDFPESSTERNIRNGSISGKLIT